jgi:nicotinate-nucleotide adenylyltransferase
VAVALFGTSADPPTEGHRVLLEGLLQRYPQVAAWASDNPMKQHGQPLAMRMALLEALIAAIGDPRLSLEASLSSPWAIETLERARRRWPDQELVFVVGSDLVAQIPRWRQARAVLEGCRLAIAPRQGWPLQEGELAGLEALGGRAEILTDLEVPGTASSHVRQGAPALGEVPAALRSLLLEHNLYGLAGPPSPPAP